MVEGVAMCPECSGGFTLRCLKLKFGVLAEEVQFLEMYFEVLDGSGSNANVICIAMVIVCDDSGG
jgi:hypothetical protein